MTPFQALIPRDADGKVNGWIDGMSPCWCKKAGLDDGKHIFDHCKYDDNGNLSQARGCHCCLSSGSGSSGPNGNSSLSGRARRIHR